MMMRSIITLVSLAALSPALAFCAPSGTYAYVTNNSADTVSVINTAPRTSAGTGTIAVTGLTPSARIRRRSRAARWPV